MSYEFRPLINLKSKILEHAYVVEVANGHEMKGNEIVPNCTLNLIDKLFSIDLIPIELRSIDIVVGMDILSKNQVDIGCFENVVRIPL